MPLLAPRRSAAPPEESSREIQSSSPARRWLTRRKTLWVAVTGCLLVLLALLLLLARRPPAVARLLPEADAIVYLDLAPVRLLTHFDRQPIAHSPGYQQFIDSTGILPERDLDEAAFALHRMADPAGPNGAVGYSEVLRGRFDAARLTGFLRAGATAEESYAGHAVFTLPVADPTLKTGARALRVTLLDGSHLAASNMPTAEQIHAMLDRERTPGPVRSGPLLLTANYAALPAGSVAWGIGQLALPVSEGGRVSLLGLALPLDSHQPMRLSLRYVTSLQLRLELLAGDGTAARTQSEALRGLLALSRALTLGNPGSPAPASLAELLQSVQITPEGDRTVLRATIPGSLLRELTGPARKP